ncbi:MAG: heme-binding protein [Phycisphaerales bacterium]|nr:heme-binding protein [Phycisphaerales bacterium]
MLVAALTSILAGTVGFNPPTTGEKIAPQAKAPESKAIPTADPEDGKSIRILGDAQVTRTAQDFFVYEQMLINTPLPVGYPDPTPPGVIEIKRYPLVRRAEVTGTMSPGIGMNLAFFPLFRHIQSRDIEMTSPVEMNYTGTGKKTPEGGDAKPDTWTMSFLYRRTDQGPTGPDATRQNVKVVDVPAMTVISMGVRGSYDYARMQREWQKLEKWLSEQAVWDAAGEPRALHYNGPERREADKWSEVQIPIRLVAKNSSSTPSGSSASTPGESSPKPADAGSGLKQPPAAP